MAADKKNGRKAVMWRRWVTVVMLALLGFAVAKNWEQFVDSMQVVRSVSPLALLGMAALFCTTTAAAALTYRLLAFRTAPYKAFYLVEFAAAGINRLLPSGVGSMGLHGVFLHRQKHTVPEAVAVVSVNNALGLVTHLLLLALIVLFSRTSAEAFTVKAPGWTPFIIAGVVVVVLVGLLFVRPVRRRLVRFLQHFGQSIRRYGDRPWHVTGAAVSSLGITLVNVLIFAVAVSAVGISAGFIELFLIYTVGVLFGSVTPTPGGLGGVEAGLMAGLVAAGFPATQALAAALTFRLATYWFPMAAGTLAFFAARARKLV